MIDYQIHVASGIMIKNKKLLAGRSRNRPFFIIPGGKLEPGETSEHAAIREIQEEFGVDIKLEDLKPFDVIYEDAALGSFNKGKIVRADVFMVGAWTGEPKATSEVDELVWIDSSALANMELGGILKNHVLPRLKKEGLVG